MSAFSNGTWKKGENQVILYLRLLSKCCCQYGCQTFTKVPKSFNPMIIAFIQISQMIVGVIVTGIAFHYSSHDPTCGIKNNNRKWIVSMHPTFFGRYYSNNTPVQLRKSEVFYENDDISLLEVLVPCTKRENKIPIQRKIYSRVNGTDTGTRMTSRKQSISKTVHNFLSNMVCSFFSQIFARKVQIRSKRCFTAQNLHFRYIVSLHLKFHPS